MNNISSMGDSNNLGMTNGQTTIQLNPANTTMITLKTKDELQTVPVHPNMLSAGIKNANAQASSKTKSKQSGGSNSSTKIKSMSSGPSTSGATSATTTPGPISSSRRNTDTSSLAGSVYSPINPDDPEAAKIEKKRERNREAARKCRTRKLEKIAELEKQVNTLKESNNAQEAKIRTLREEIQQLHVKFESHQRLHNCDLKI